MNDKITVFYHSADADGWFCREIARKFLPTAELIGWDFKDEPLPIPAEGQIYVLDLPVDRLFGFDFGVMVSSPGSPARNFEDMAMTRCIWIDHHIGNIDNHPNDIKGYRIDGVAACRLAWQWFYLPRQERDEVIPLPNKEEFTHRKVTEPLAVRLAGEYDIWDKRDPRAELFQHGLRTRELGENMWELLLSPQTGEGEVGDGRQSIGDVTVDALLEAAEVLQYARAKEYAQVIKEKGFTVEFEGVKFLACNSHELDIRSHLFEAGIKPEHEALLGFTFNGKDWRVSLYHIKGKEHWDILSIAQKHGGNGHKGACGFRIAKLPFLP